MIRANAADQLRDKAYLWPCCVIDIGRDMLSREGNEKVHWKREYLGIFVAGCLGSALTCRWECKPSRTPCKERTDVSI